MKKFIALLLAFLVITVSLCSCGKDDDDDGKKTPGSEEKTENVGTENKEDERDMEPEKDDGFIYEGVSVMLPKGFITEKGSLTIAVPSTYPTDADNITFSYSQAGSVKDFTKESFDSYFPNLLEKFEPGDDDDYEIFKTDGNDTVKYTYRVEANGIKMEQTIVVLLLKSKTVTITFTSVTGKYDRDFEKCIDSLKLIDE